MIEILLVLILIFMLSALPLYFSVKVMGGKTTLLLVILVNLLVGLVTFIVKYLFDTWGGVFAFILMIGIYKEMFRIGLMRALLVWILQFAFAMFLFMVAITVLGVTFFA